MFMKMRILRHSLFSAPGIRIKTHPDNRMMGHRITRSVNQRGSRDHKFLDEAVVEARPSWTSPRKGARIEKMKVLQYAHLRLQEAGCVCHYLAKIVRIPSPGELSCHHSGLRCKDRVRRVAAAEYGVQGPCLIFVIILYPFGWDLA